MNYIPPNKIKINSDGNEMEYQRTVEGKETLFVYKFIKSNMKLDWEFGMSQSFIEKQLRNFFKVIE